MTAWRIVTTLVAIAQELFKLAAAGCERSAAIRVAVTLLVFAILWSLWITACALLGFGVEKSRYRIHDLAGSVAYEDGSNIPADMMLLKFFPTAGQEDKTYAATPVIARVKVGNGRFDAKVVGRKDALEASAIWKVVVLSGEQEPISEAVVPAEYGDLEKTPLKLQLNSVFLEIRIRKPVK